MPEFNEIGWLRTEYETLHFKYAAAVIRRNALEREVQEKEREVRGWQILSGFLSVLVAVLLVVFG